MIKVENEKCDIETSDGPEGIMADLSFIVRVIKKTLPVQASPVQTAAPVQAAPVAPVVPTVEHTYTLDDLANAAMTLMDKGMQTQLQNLLAGYGVEALPALPKNQYGNFATALRGMGANI